MTPDSDGYVVLPQEFLSQDVEIYQHCPACGNRYMQAISLQELVDRLHTGKLVDTLANDRDRPLPSEPLPDV